MAKKTVALQKRDESSIDTTQKDTFRHQNIRGRLTGSRTVTPPVDIVENADEITLIADMPGIEKDDLHVAVDKDILTIAGHRDVPHPENFDWEDIHPEYERVRYHREFRLGKDIEKDQVNAAYQDGVLRVTLPKTEDARPKRIEIKGD